jgi:hypothetical protein
MVAEIPMQALFIVHRPGVLRPEFDFVDLDVVTAERSPRHVGVEDAGYDGEALGLVLGQILVWNPHPGPT